MKGWLRERRGKGRERRRISTYQVQFADASHNRFRISNQFQLNQFIMEWSWDSIKSVYTCVCLCMGSNWKSVIFTWHTHTHIHDRAQKPHNHKIHNRHCALRTSPPLLSNDFRCCKPYSLAEFSWSKDQVWVMVDRWRIFDRSRLSSVI